MPCFLRKVFSKKVGDGGGGGDHKLFVRFNRVVEHTSGCKSGSDFKN